MTSNVASISGGVINCTGQVYVDEGQWHPRYFGQRGVCGDYRRGWRHVRCDNSAAVGILNLRGGTLTTGFVKMTQGTSTLNFNGGTLKASQNNTNFMTGLTSAYIYSGGATIDDSGKAITIGQALLAPTGSGVGIGSYSISGSGFVAPPIVTVVGTGCRCHGGGHD